MPCVIVRERLEQMTSVISDMTGHRRDYNAVMSMVQAAHENTLRLSALITPTVAVTCVVSCAVCLLLCVYGILPRPECRVLAPTPPLGCSDNVAADGVGFEQDHVFDLLPPWLCYVVAAVFYINALLPLYAAAVNHAFKMMTFVFKNKIKMTNELCNSNGQIFHLQGYILGGG